MRTAFIHIGMHKTGSSSIQHSLARGDWPEHHYIQTGGPNHSVMLDNLLQEGRAAAAPMLDALQAELRQVTKPNIILSGENLSGSKHIRQPELTFLRDLLIPHVDRIQVIGYVRPPASMIRSVFQQGLKLATGDREFLSLPKILYRRRLRAFDAVFGRENVTLVKFDRATLTGGDAVLDFADRIGLELPAERALQINSSLSQEAVAVFYARARYGIDTFQPHHWHRTRQTPREVLTNLGSTPFQLSAELLQPTLDQMEEQIAWVEKRLGATLREQPQESADAIGSFEDLLTVAGRQRAELRERLLARLDAEPDEARAVAQMLDMIRFLAMHRQMAEDRAGAGGARKAGARP